MKKLLSIMLASSITLLGSAQVKNSINTVHLKNGAVTKSKIGTGQVVLSLNNLTDKIDLKAGANITIIPLGNTLTISATDSANSATDHWNVNGNQISNKNSGNVGIGTPSPESRLHVSSGSVLMDNNQFLQNKDENGNIRNVIGTLSDGTVEVKGFHGTPMIQGVNGNTYLYGSGGAGTLGLTVSADGKVGIGTRTPSMTLEVSGSIKTTSVYVDKFFGSRLMNSGFSFLGGVGAPGIKMKKLTGTYKYKSGDHSNIEIEHGLSAEKILSVNIHIFEGALGAIMIPPNYETSTWRGVLYNYLVGPKLIHITANASRLDNGIIQILIIYEE